MKDEENSQNWLLLKLHTSEGGKQLSSDGHLLPPLRAALSARWKKDPPFPVTTDRKTRPLWRRSLAAGKKPPEMRALNPEINDFCKHSPLSLAFQLYPQAG